MTKSFTAAFAKTPRTGTAVVTAAIGSLSTDAPTNTQLLATAGTDGCVVTKVSAMPRATSGATSLVLFLVKASAPAIYRLIASEAMGSYAGNTASAVPQAVFSGISETAPMRLEAGDKLYVGTQTAVTSGVVFRAEWTDY